MYELYFQYFGILFIEFIINKIPINYIDNLSNITYNSQEENYIDQVSMILF